MTKKRYKYLVTESQLNYFLESASSGKLVVYDFYKGIDSFIQAFIKDPIGTPLNDFIKTNYPELDKKTLIKKLVDENILNKEVIVDDSVLVKSKIKFSLPQKGYYEKTKRLFNLLEKEKQNSKVEENVSSPYDTNVKFDDRIYIARNKKNIPLSQGAVDNVVTYNKIIESKEGGLNKFLEKFKEVFYDPKTTANPIDFYGAKKKIKNWPDVKYVDGGSHIDDVKNVDKSSIRTESLDLENHEMLDLTNDKFVFWAGGDWQPSFTVTIKLVNGDLKVTDCKPHKKGDGKEIKLNDVLKKIGVYDEYKQKQKEKEDKKNYDWILDDYVKEYNEWNKGGYETPTESSVLEFFQNNHEQYSKDEKLKKGLLDKLIYNNKTNKVVESTLNKLMGESHLLTEEITRTEVKDEIEKYIKSSDFLNNIKKILDTEFKKSKVMEDKMVEIASNVLVQLYKSLWTKRGFWKGDLKNSAS